MTSDLNIPSADNAISAAECFNMSLLCIFSSSPITLPTWMSNRIVVHAYIHFVVRPYIHFVTDKGATPGIWASHSRRRTHVLTAAMGRFPSGELEHGSLLQQLPAEWPLALSESGF